METLMLIFGIFCANLRSQMRQPPQAGLIFFEAGAAHLKILEKKKGRKKKGKKKIELGLTVVCLHQSVKFQFYISLYNFEEIW